MLKALITVIDENDRILQDKRLIFEENSVPVSLGIAHEFRFEIITANNELIHKLNKSCEGFTSRANEIKEAWENDMDIDDGGTE